MGLINFLIILFGVLVIRQTIKGVSHYINTTTKKLRHVGTVNYIIAKEILWVFIELINKKWNFYLLVYAVLQEGNKNISATISNNRAKQQFKLENGKRKQFPLFKMGNKNCNDYTKLYAASKSFTKNYNLVNNILSQTNLSQLTIFKKLKGHYALS